MHAGCACLWNPHSRILDSDREWCDLASLVWVESKRHYGDRVTTDVCCFPACPQGQVPVAGGVPALGIEYDHYYC